MQDPDILYYLLNPFVSILFTPIQSNLEHHRRILWSDYNQQWEIMWKIDHGILDMHLIGSSQMCSSRPILLNIINWKVLFTTTEVALYAFSCSIC